MGSKTGVVWVKALVCVCVREGVEEGGDKQVGLWVLWACGVLLVECSMWCVRVTVSRLRNGGKRGGTGVSV